MSIGKAVWTQRLDAAGDFSAELPLGDPQTAAIQSGKVYRHYQEGRGFCFAGSIESSAKTPPDGLGIAGDSLLVELLYDNTLIGKEYTDTSINDIIDDLLDGSGWTRLGSITDLISVRFDGESKLRAILAVVDMVGQHVRERVSEASGALVRQLEIGLFGISSNIVVSNGSVNDLAISDEGLAVIPEGEFAIEEATTEVWNWLLPLGAGEGVSQLTLVQQTRLPNLIPNNPSFEAGLDGWIPLIAPTSDTSRSVHGKRCLKTETSGFFNNDGVSQDFSSGVAAGATYRAEAWLWKDGAGDLDQLRVEFLSSDDSLIDVHSVSTNIVDRWVRLDTGDMLAPEGTASIRIYLLNVALADHTTYFDLPRVWRIASDVGLAYDVLTEVTTPTDLFPQINWYISDPASIASYGRRQRPFVAKDIAPLSFTKPAFQAAANALYDLATAQLDRWKLTQNAYRLGAIGLAPDVLPGDTVRLRYKGMARRDAGDAEDERYMYVDVDQDLYVLERQTTWEDVSKDTLLVSDVDRQLQNDDEVVIGKLEDTIRAFKTHVQTGIGIWAEHLGPEEVDVTHPFTLNARVPDNIVQLLRLMCTITPRAIRSPVDVAADGGASAPTTSSGGSANPTSSSGGSQTPASAGGGSASPTSESAPHVHDVGLISDTSELWVDTFYRRSVVLQQTNFGGLQFWLATDDLVSGLGGTFQTLGDSTPHTHVVTIGNHTHTVAIVAHTHTVSIPNHQHSVTIPNHDHGLDFGIFEGSSAAGIGITIDGVSRTSELGGPWSSPATLDLTRYFLDNDGVVVQGDHTIILSSSQLGRIEARLEWAVTAAALRQ